MAIYKDGSKKSVLIRQMEKDSILKVIRLLMEKSR